MKKKIYNFKIIFIFQHNLKTNTFIPAMIQRNYPVRVVVLCKICKIPHYSCNRLLIRRKTLTSDEEFEFWEETEIISVMRSLDDSFAEDQHYAVKTSWAISRQDVV
jgi:hypothetical protein